MYSEIVILAMLRQRPQHGYELKKCIEQALGGTVSLNNNVLYPALKHFEALGAVVREVVPQEGRPNRHIYQLTERGSDLAATTGALSVRAREEGSARRTHGADRATWMRSKPPSVRSLVRSRRDGDRSCPTVGYGVHGRATRSVASHANERRHGLVFRDFGERAS